MDRDAMSGLSDASDLDAVVMQSLERVRTFVDARLDAALEMSADASPRLFDAMRYALLAPGKRLRPALVFYVATQPPPSHNVQRVGELVDLYVLEKTEHDLIQRAVAKLHL